MSNKRSVYTDGNGSRLIAVQGMGEYMPLDEFENMQNLAKLAADELIERTRERDELAAQVSVIRKSAAAVCLEFPEKISNAQFSLMHAIHPLGMIGNAGSCLKIHDALNAAKAIEEAADYMMAYLGLPKDTTSVSTIALKEYAANIKAKAGIK